MGIFEAIKYGLGIAYAWITGYSSKENTKARVENDKTKKKDEMNSAITNENIEEERKRLS